MKTKYFILILALPIGAMFMLSPTLGYLNTGDLISLYVFPGIPIILFTKWIFNRIQKKRRIKQIQNRFAI